MEEVGPLGEDNLEMHENILRSLVQVVCYEPPTPSKPERDIKAVLTGIIVASGDDFCYVIALWNVVHHTVTSSGWSYEVIFSDGTKQDLPIDKVKTQASLAAFYLSTSVRLDPVNFNEQKLSRNEDVFAVGFQKLPSMPSYISNGRVTHSRDGSFSHDCPPFLNSINGDAVFNKNSEFVGISYKDRVMTIALSIHFTRKILSMFHDNMFDRPLPEILQRIRDNGNQL